MGSSLDSGRRAEQVAAAFLQQQGYVVHAHNWRTRWCEIDLVAQKAQVLFFVEVKYRRTATWGSGLEAITPKKLRQMQLAARFWVHVHQWSGEISLAAMALEGDSYEIVDWLPFVEV